MLLKFYRFIFCRPFFYAFNLHLYKLSLRGIGVLNSEGPEITGEKNFLEQLWLTSKIKTIVDVGANTEAYGADLFPRAMIYAFEPHPNTFALLKENTQKNGHKNVRLINAGLSSKKGKMELWDFADDAELKETQPTSTLASFDKSVIEKLHGQKAQAVEVKVDTLDAFAKRNKISYIDLLKIDTEGHEFHVLLGAKELLSRNKVGIVQFEFNEMNAFGDSKMKDFYELLPSHEFYRLMPNGLYPLGKYRPLTHEIFGFQNIVAVPKKQS